MPREIVLYRCPVAKGSTMADGRGDDTADLFTRHKLNIDEYYWMVDAEILREDDRVELIDGESSIWRRSGLGTRPSSCV